ncbi:core protein precursor pX [Crane-associated adenovirus 1]|uniref:Core protein pX n=1 Tax=Crane-associated adenovirus 1 TaxID=2559941 RepID=A0A5H2WYM8_9ADEN|nr:core protein precursor pX [Crane-associated adenovirus 1]
MPSVMLLGGKSRRTRSTKRKRRSTKSSIISIPRIPTSRRRTRRTTTRPVVIQSPVDIATSERAALQNLASRLQRGNFTKWRSANVQSAAANASAESGQPMTAYNTLTGDTAHAVPIATHSGEMRGGILPALIPIIAAAIGAIPGIAGTAVGIASLQEQKRQFNQMYNNNK